MTTIYTATKHLSPRTRKAVIELWKATDVMDLDYPHLADRFDVVRQVLVQTRERVKTLEKLLYDIKKMINDKNVVYISLSHPLSNKRTMIKL